jgi:hypothetical protein
MGLTKKEISEQIQEDIIAYCDGMPSEVVDELCQIVIDNFKKLN